MAQPQNIGILMLPDNIDFYTYMKNSGAVTKISAQGYWPIIAIQERVFAHYPSFPFKLIQGPQQ